MCSYPSSMQVSNRCLIMLSDAFRQPPAGMAAVPHSAIIELEGAILGAEIIALLLQPADARPVAQVRSSDSEVSRQAGRA